MLNQYSGIFPLLQFFIIKRFINALATFLWLIKRFINALATVLRLIKLFINYFIKNTPNKTKLFVLLGAVILHNKGQTTHFLSKKAILQLGYIARMFFQNILVGKTIMIWIREDAYVLVVKIR